MKTLEQLFPDAAARIAADQAVDKLDLELPMSTYLDTWETEYFRVAKKSPFRRKKL